MPITEREQSETDAANQSGRPPVVFVHGLWLLANSWTPWRELFEERGYATVAPDWPDDPATTAEAVAHPEALAGKSIGAVTDHLAEVIGTISRPPIVIGHSFGGLLAQKLAGMGLAAGAVAIDPAPFRGVLPLPISALRSAFPVLKNPANRKKAVMLTFEQWRYGFTNAIPEDEARQLYEAYAVPGSGRPLFQAATANFNWKTEASVDTERADRGPLLIISGELDHTVPWKIANASFKRYKAATAPTEIKEIKGRGHSLVIDHGWREVADTALSFLAGNGLPA
ncbi:MAG: alpha/beta hydrolase [Ilumatobacteraceae bacterium]